MKPIPPPSACFSGRLFLTAVAISFPFCGSSAAEPAVKAGPAWSPPIEAATGNGHRGSWRGNKSEYDYVDDAAVAVNDHGFVAVAWADLPQLDILLRLYAPDGTAVFEEAVNVSRSPEVFSWIPRIVMSDGATPAEITIHAIWQDIVFRGGGHGGEIFTATSRDGGRSFEDPINLSDVIEGSGKGRTDPKRWHNGSYDIFAGPDGTVHAAWTEYEGRLWYSRSTTAGFPVLRIDKRDRLLLAWERFPGFPSRPHGLGFSQSEDGGRTFSRPLVVPGLGGPPDQGFNGSQQGLLAAKFSASPSGCLAMANSLFISGESSRILFVTATPPENPGAR